MSTPAPALPLRRVTRHPPRRRRVPSRAALQWHDVPVAPSLAGPGRAQPPRRWLIAIAIAIAMVAVFAAHALAAWYGGRFSLAARAQPKQNTLALQIVRPPPPAPKAEPPPPPKRTPPRAPPPIQTAAVVPSEAPLAAPVQTVAAVAPAEPAAPPPPAPIKPAFGGIGYKNNPAPDYPALAVRQGWQGTVLLRVKVLGSGSVAAIEVVKSSGRKLLDDAAIATVQRWVFAPSTQGDTPIDGFATVPIEFKLDS